MDQNPLVDIANNIKQNNLDIKIACIQEDVQSLRQDMANLMTEMTKLSERYMRLNTTLESIEQSLDKPKNISKPTPGSQTYIK